MSVQTLGWVVLIPLAVLAIWLYTTMSRGVALVCLVVIVILVARLLFAKRM